MKNATQRLVMKNAWDIVRNLGVKFVEALKRAWQAIKAESLEYFKIKFIKESTGEITERVGSNARIKNGTHLSFHSITDNGYRQAIIKNIISVEPANVEYKVEA
jgi:hypothetical protein